MKKLPILLILFGSFKVLSAPATGFDETFVKPEPPNTIAGILNNARTNDYALLRGQFIKIIDKENFLFSDENNDEIIVYFPNGNIPIDLTLNYEYFLWTKVIEKDGQMILQAEIISPHF